MSVTLSVPDELRETVGAFIKAEGVSIETVSGGGGGVQVVKSAGRQQSDASTLESGGWITCSTARGVADKLGIDGLVMGKLLDLLNVKVRQCELGCF